MGKKKKIRTKAGLDEYYFEKALNAKFFPKGMASLNKIKKSSLRKFCIEVMIHNLDVDIKSIKRFQSILKNRLALEKKGSFSKD